MRLLGAAGALLVETRAAYWKRCCFNLKARDTAENTSSGYLLATAKRSF